uniref:ANK_REP_REGION domain-containing protein n=1 Tax=Caenorhabditis japonica TaxID=281687 RepID=A0A8R1I9L7_CAEJA
MSLKESEEQSRTISDNRSIYKMVDMHGGGILIKLARQCKELGSFDILDAYIDGEVRKHLYNGGKGKLMPIAELVKARNKERNAKLGAFSRKKGKGKSGPNILDELGQGQAEMGDLKKALKLLDGGGKGGKAESKYREIIWNLEERGTMGENLLAICLLQGSPLHNIISKRLIHFFPKLINDIAVSEDYYGMAPLHMAIVNQDAQFTSLLIRLGADLNQRCYGAFFCAEDQKASRTDSLEHEFVELSKNTNYKGSMYFGEYPLSFAICTGQVDLLRMLLAKKANLNAQDTNGNTVLHLCVIHNKMDMLDAALEAGANLKIANKQNLTPLTLAAKLAKKTMFNKILQLECEKVWTYGASQCVAYPLTKIDTIDETTGEMNDASALSLVVYGVPSTGVAHSLAKVVCAHSFPHTR